MISVLLLFLSISLKVAQINYFSRNQPHCTANLNFGLICKKAKHTGLCQQTFHFCSADIFFDDVLLLAELAQKIKIFKIAV